MTSKVTRGMSDEEKQKIYDENAKEMESCFSVTNAFWGIDKVVLSLKGQFHINNQELDLAASMKNNFSITKKYDKLGTISELKVKSSTFGSFLMGKNPFDGSYFYRIELIHCGLNISTDSIEGIYQRLNRALLLLEHEIGISCTIYHCEFQEIELAFTMAIQSPFHLQTRTLLLRCLTNKKVNFASSSNRIKDKEYDILTTNRSKNEEQVLYNKTNKAKRLGQLDKAKTEAFEVYRFETVLKKDKIKSLLTTCDLEEIDNLKIIQYLENLISIGVFNFIKEIEQSVINTDRELSKIFKEKPRATFEELLKKQINVAHSTNTPLVLDEEILSLINAKFVSKENRSRYRKNLIAKSQKELNINSEAFYLAEMVTWNVLIILRLMFDALDFARNNRLGCHKNYNTNELHIVQIPTFSKEFRNKIYSLNNKLRRKHHYNIDLYKLILNRLLNLKELFNVF
ncbi:hypothetical protein [Streptococcus suis]|uniref:Uncharacterized protein n=2 Tax=Streptococcus suis TaxID=1307 RepID=A0A0Z8FZG7_STRSU|nr:hypothetical protein [Streptococcus suis]NQH65868.1 hypothetical protein [Streptococcus suis]NQO20150.1 hypothetical protein [Streptococcus suis]NQO24400.1 hypothetical protein [Streptococcus suis]NQO82057.1 hypothetical protein [Streptococcus suis]NQR97316.1 hypothetical protein [Streptococcus suis]